MDKEVSEWAPWADGNPEPARSLGRLITIDIGPDLLAKHPIHPIQAQIAEQGEN